MRLLPALILAVFLAAALAAQTPARPQQPTFKAGVNLVRVDAYVTANGRAVPDLNEADFEVREDGVLQRIETFERVVAAPSTSEVDRDEPANVDESNEAAGNARNRHYLLGYYSTNSKTDGKFRTITVRVRRQGAQVLARPGYYALSDAEIAARARADAPLDPEVARLNKLLSTLGTERPDVPLRIAAGCCFESSASDGAPGLALWVTAELDAATARTMEWSGGADAEVTMTPADSTRPLAVQHSSIEPAVPRFNVRFRDLHLLPGDYRVKVQLSRRSGDTGGEIAQVRVRVPDVSATGANVLGEPMLFRRGPYTGREFHPTADKRFRRTEGIRVDVPVAGPVDLLNAQLLDRHGKPLRLELTAGQREDGGQRFATTEIALASFAPGDFLVEVTVRRGHQTEKAVTAFRVVP